MAKKKFDPRSPENLKKLGINVDRAESQLAPHKMVDTFDELKKSTPLMMVAKALETFQAPVQSDGRAVQFEKNIEYFMPMSTFTQVLQMGKQQGNRILWEEAKVPFKNRFRRYNGENINGKKLLIWRFGGIGDLLFVQPLVKYLRATYPEAFITFASAPNNLQMIHSWPPELLSACVGMPFSANILDEHDFHLTFEGSIERCHEAEKMSAINVFRHMANLDFNPNDYPTELISDPQIDFRLQPYIPENVIAMHLRASAPHRTYPIPQLRDLIEKLLEVGYEVGIVDARNNSFAIDDYIIGQFFSDPKRVHNLARFSNDLAHFISILSLSKAVIGVDSAGYHIAEALGKPTVTLHGPFTSKVHVEHYKHTIGLDAPSEWNNQCGKYPCFAHGPKISECPSIKANLPAACISAISHNDIVKALGEIIAKHEI